MNILDLLLSKTPQYPEKSVKMARLSKELGEEVVFKIRALPYTAVQDYIKSDAEDSDINIVLGGLVEPDLKDSRLLNKYGAVTPAELLRDARFLRPGEVLKLSNEIGKLSGFGEKVFEEIEKN